MNHIGRPFFRARFHPSPSRLILATQDRCRRARVRDAACRRSVRSIIGPSFGTRSDNMRDATELRGSARAGRPRGYHPGLGLFKGPALTLLILGVAASVEAGPVVPGPVFDPQGDFVSTYDATLPRTSDLDVRLAQVLYNPGAQTLTLIAQMWGTLGQTPTAIYVWGIDHGHGTEQFQLTGTPLTGAGVFFDQVMVVRLPPGTTTLLGQTFTAQISTTSTLNDTISLTVPVSSVPATQPGALPVDGWGSNLWPRPGTASAGNGNKVITDFAPNAAALLPTVVPEPMSVIAM